jgi:hypothetical protein
MKNLSQTIWSIYALVSILIAKLFYSRHATIIVSKVPFRYVRGFIADMLTFGQYIIHVKATGVVWCAHTNTSLYNNVEIILTKQDKKVWSI